MKRSLFFLLMCLVIFNLSAQKVTWGPELKEQRLTRISQILNSDASGTYVVKIKSSFLNTNYTIDVFNDKMVPTKTIPLDINVGGKNANIFDIYNLNDKIYVFSSLLDKSAQENNAYYNIFNGDRINGAPKEIDKFHAKSGWNPGNFNMRFNEDTSRILIYHNTPYKKGDPERFGLKVLDEDFNLVWKKEVELPYPDKLFELEDVTIDKDGKVYVLGKVYRDKAKEKVKGKANFDYSIIAYGDGKEKEYKLGIKDKFISDITFKVNGSGDLVCAGYYSDAGTHAVGGTFFMTIDGKTKETIHLSHKAFPMNFLSELIGEKKAAKGNELYKFDLSDFILRDDGGAVLIGEQYYVSSHTIRTSNGTTTHYTYYYNDIIITNIDSKGNIDWSATIPKRQRTVDDGGYYSSYALSIVKDKMYFIYNDNVKNLTSNGNRVYSMSGIKRSVVTMATVDLNGKVERKALLSNKEQGIIVRPKVCKQTGYNEMVLIGQKKKKYKIGKIKFS